MFAVVEVYNNIVFINGKTMSRGAKLVQLVREMQLEIEGKCYVVLILLLISFEQENRWLVRLSYNKFIFSSINNY